jgi:formate hydrogenlyase transcriptional activator
MTIRVPNGRKTPQASLQRQNERLQLLLNLTSRITSNLDLREVLRAISANFREVMRCDGAGIWLPGQEADTFKLYAFDSPVSKGFAKEELIITPAENDPGKRAFETMKPMVATVEEIGWPGGGEGYRLAASEGVKSACFIPLVSRGQALGDLMIVRKTEETFTAEDVDFLIQAAGQVAIAIENALAYREISELKDKLAQEKLYLEEEIRSEMDFEQIVGSSAALKHVLQLVETVAPNDSTVLLLGETGTGKELIDTRMRLSPKEINDVFRSKRGIFSVHGEDSSLQRTIWAHQGQANRIPVRNRSKPGMCGV